MKYFTLILLSVGFTFLYSCKSKEDTAKDIVDSFLKQINDDKIQKKDIDFSSVTPHYKEIFLANSYYTAQSWTLVSEVESDTSMVVKSIGKTFNSEGAPTELHQEFHVKKINGEWKITNSLNLLALFLDFEIVDQNWDFFWDYEKCDILKSLQTKLKLEILVPGHCGYFSCENREGKLKLVNNSDYDIKGVKILIEHYDKGGNSVNTDESSVYAIIRKHGYREFNWYTRNCFQCTRQKFKINFISESN